MTKASRVLLLARLLGFVSSQLLDHQSSGRYHRSNTDQSDEPGELM
jgi:hypothetical protein